MKIKKLENKKLKITTKWAYSVTLFAVVGKSKLLTWKNTSDDWWILYIIEISEMWVTQLETNFSLARKMTFIRIKMKYTSSLFIPTFWI